MNLKQYRAAYRPFRKSVYELLVNTINCGPFDGGCVLCALALQAALGGTVMVLTRPDGTAEHAALLHGGRLFDMDGPLTPTRFLRRFNRSELTHCTGYRPMRDGDLPEAPQNAALVARLAAMFKKFLEPPMDMRTIARARRLTAANAHNDAYMLVAGRLGLTGLHRAFAAINPEASGGLSEAQYRTRFRLYRKMMAHARANLPDRLYHKLYRAL